MIEPGPMPVYVHDPVKISAGRSGPRGLAVVVERVVFVFGAVAAGWLALMLMRAGFRLSLWHLGYLVGCWGVLAYLALPRLHRVMSEIYVPGYFIGRVRTGDGLLGDPVNLAANGTAAQLDAAMRAAGWTTADPITARSAWRIIVSSVTGRSYPEAPVSNLYLFGRAQDVAYQQEVENSPAKRHHVRFWKCPPGWYLPGGHQVDWVAAGTYDRAVGLSMFTLQVTHKIDADTDVERDYIVATVLHANPQTSVDRIENFSTGYHHRNGGGDLIVTDGHLPVMDLTGLSVTAAPDGTDVAAVGTGTAVATAVAPASEDVPAAFDPGAVTPSHASAGEEELATTPSEGMPPRPLVFLIAVLSIAVGSLLSVVQGTEYIPDGDGLDLSGGDQLVMLGVVALVVALVQVPLLVLILRGHSWARYLVLVSLALNVLSVMTGPVDLMDASGAVGLLINATSIVALLALSDRSASEWVHTIRAARRAERARRRAAANA